MQELKKEKLSDQFFNSLESQISLLECILKSTSDWVFVKDKNLCYVLANDNYSQAIGKTTAEIIGKQDLDLGFCEKLVFENPQEDIRNFYEDDATVLQGKSVRNIYNYRTDLDGSTKIVDFQKIPLFNSSKEVFAILGIAREISQKNPNKPSGSELKSHSEQLEEHLKSQLEQLSRENHIFKTEIIQRQEVEAQLWGMQKQIRSIIPIIRRSEQRYRSLILASAQLIWTADAEGKFQKILSWKGETKRVLSDLEENSWFSFIHPQDRDRIISSWGKAIANKDFYEQECRIKTHDNSYRYFLIRAVPVLADDGDIGEWAGICTDIHHFKQVQRNLEQKSEELKTALQELYETKSQLIQNDKMSSLGQLVAGIAHEINNPVNFIYGNLKHASGYTQDLLKLLNLYQQNYPEPEKVILEEAEAMDIDFVVDDLPNLMSSVKMGSQRIRDIVMSLRNFSHVDEVEMKEYDIHEGIDDTLMILQYRLKTKPNHPGIKILKNYGDIPLVECYPGQLSQVFMNIFCNAIDALEERDKQRNSSQIEDQPSYINVSTNLKRKGSVEICIEDNGLGISEEIQKQIFEPFYTTKPAGKGTGLGMSISCQIITEKHGGSIKCISESSRGAKFLIEIPIHQDKGLGDTNY